MRLFGLAVPVCRKHVLRLPLAVAGWPMTLGAVLLPLAAQAQSSADEAPADSPAAETAPPVAEAPPAAQPPPAVKPREPPPDAVVVSAQRRRELAREVPMQVEELSADDLQQGGAHKLKDYVPQDPGVDFQSVGGAGLGQLSIRGVTTGTQTSPTVGVYVDEVGIGSSTVYGSAAQFALDMGLLDLDHIEILRGPQGTLYGAGAMGGVFKYVSQVPDVLHFGGDVGAGLSVTQRGGINNVAHAVVNEPFGSGLGAVRISGFNTHDAGYVDAIGPKAGKNVEHGDTTGGRVSLLLQPAQDWTLHFNAILQEINRHGQDFVDYDMAGHPVNGDLKRQLDADEPFHQTVQLYSLDLEYRMSWASFNAISSYQSIRTQLVTDVTPDYQPIFAASGLNLDTVTSPGAFYTSKYTDELRLASSGNRTVEWLTGLYFTHEGNSLRQGFEGTEAGMGETLEDIHIPTTYQEYAAYGDVTWHATQALSITGGARVAHNNQAYADTTSGLLVGAPTYTPGSSSDTSTTYLGTIKYQLTRESNVYVRSSSGYRPGGPNDEVVDPVTRKPVAGRPTFDPDKLYSYEGGYKGDFFQQRLSLQVAAFDIYWKHIQQRGSVDGVNQFVNTGDARIKGAELGSVWRPNSRWETDVALSYIEAQVKTGSPEVGAKPGNDLPNTPKFSAVVSESYLHTVFGYKASSGVSERYIGKRQSDFESETTSPDLTLPAYAVTDLQSGIDFKRASLTMFLRNAFDRRGLQGAQTGFVPIGGSVQATVIQPRTIGLEANVPF